MTVEPELLELMQDVVTVFRYTGTDTHGQRRWSPTGTRVRCRIQRPVRKVMGQDGMELVASHEIILTEQLGLSPMDRVELPKRFQPQTPDIKAVDGMDDQNGAYYEVIYC